MRLKMFVMVTALVLSAGLAPAEAATYTVMNTNDSGAGSLRQAIADANATPDDDVVAFDPTVFATPQTITLTSGSLNVLAGGRLSIEGPGPDRLTVSGSPVQHPETMSRQVFMVFAGAEAVISGVKITLGTGFPSRKSDGTFHPDDGGGIWNKGTLTVLDSLISGNHAQGSGGGIHNEGSLTVTRTTVDGNRSDDGGGISSTNLAVIRDSTISHNEANPGVGGGIFCPSGGTHGIDQLVVINSTISGNTAEFEGAGIWSRDGAAFIISSTTSGNTTRNVNSVPESGIWNQLGLMTVRNSIIADGGDGMTSQGFNLISGSHYVIVGGPRAGDVVGMDPGLGPLAWNGGPTKTHALLPGSPAINAGSNAGAVDQDNAPLPFDQRSVGFSRIRGGVVDIGAFEAPDDDGDGVLNAIDNCPAASNASQLDTDGDTAGDACDADDDNDSVPDAQDAFPLNPNESLDSDGDGSGNNADPDDDNDGIADAADNCALVANPEQADYDRDGIGNACDATPGSPIEVVFVSTRDSAPRSLNLEIYGMRADGSGVVRLTNHPALDVAPSLSPDRRRVLFTSTRDNNRTEIFVMDADGANVQRLTTNASIEGAAVWSPDGTRIAFTSTRDGNAEIYVMTLAGATVTRLTIHSKLDINPAWSPDGSRIAFASNRNNGNFEIYTMNPDGTGLVRLTNQKADDAFPTWSPDSSKIAFTSTRDGNLDIYAMNATTGAGVSRLTNHRAIDVEPAWGKDGRIVFTSTRGGTSKIYRMNADGSGVTPLTNHPTGYDLSPDW